MDNSEIGICYVMLRIIFWVFLVRGTQMRLMLFGLHLSVKFYEAKITISPKILDFHLNWSEHSIFYASGTKSPQIFKILNSQF